MRASWLRVDIGPSRLDNDGMTQTPTAPMCVIPLRHTNLEGITMQQFTINDGGQMGLKAAGQPWSYYLVRRVENLSIGDAQGVASLYVRDVFAGDGVRDVAYLAIERDGSHTVYEKLPSGCLGIPGGSRGIGVYQRPGENPRYDDLAVLREELERGLKGALFDAYERLGLPVPLTLGIS